MAAGDWIDAMRRFIPPEERLYSWWSYRARDWDDADNAMASIETAKAEAREAEETRF